MSGGRPPRVERRSGLGISFERALVGVGRVSVFLVSGRRLLAEAVPGVTASLGDRRIARASRLAIFTLASVAPPRARDWLPFVYVSFGYYVTGRLFVKPSEALEAWLLELGPPAARRSHDALRPLAGLARRVPRSRCTCACFCCCRPVSPRSSWRGTRRKPITTGRWCWRPISARLLRSVFFKPDRHGCWKAPAVLAGRGGAPSLVVHGAQRHDLREHVSERTRRGLARDCVGGDGFDACDRRRAAGPGCQREPGLRGGTLPLRH